MRRTMTIALGMLVLAGCSKLNQGGTIEVGPREVRSVEVTAPTYAQTVQVKVEPDTCAVSAYLVKQSDVNAVTKQLDADKEPDKAMVLGGKTFKAADAKADYTIEGAVPAKTAFALVLHGGKASAKVKYQITAK